MKELEVTWSRVLSIWWSYIWRVLLISALISAIVGFLAGFVSAFAGMVELLGYIINIMSFLIGIFVSVGVLKYILNKNFGEFKIKLISDEVTPDEVRRHLKNMVENQSRQG